MPRDPPVTTATLPRMEKSEEMSPSGEVSSLAVISVLPVMHGVVAGPWGTDHRACRAVVPDPAAPAPDRSRRGDDSLEKRAERGGAGPGPMRISEPRRAALRAFSP
jgi:hypothetical protein